MLGYGITGINGLGTFGLGGSSTYSSYYDPTTMGLAGSYGMGELCSPYGTMGAMGMMGGMYNPTFMASYMREMNQAQQQIEIDKLNHAGTMHNLQLQNQTVAFSDTDRAIFEKAMVDASINKSIQNLAVKVKEGDADGICQAFDEAKQALYTKYSDYFKANASRMNPADSVTNYIENLYTQIVSKDRGEIVSLRNDIKKYGETAFEHGFWKSFHGKDYHDKYSEETISYVFGTPVDNKSGKDRMEKYGAYAEKGTELAAAAAIGAVALPTAVSAAKGVTGSVVSTVSEKGAKWFAEKSAFNKKWAWAGAALAIAGDWLWQQSRA